MIVSRSLTVSWFRAIGPIKVEPSRCCFVWTVAKLAVRKSVVPVKCAGDIHVWPGDIHAELSGFLLANQHNSAQPKKLSFWLGLVENREI